MQEENGIHDGCDGWELVLSFPDQSPSFARGVEFGKLWAILTRMDHGDAACVQQTTMAENREVIRRLAEYLGWQIEVTPYEVKGWDMTAFTKIKPDGKDRRVNPHGLRIV